MTRITQAGAVPYRVTAHQVEVLLVTASSGRWTIPKGGIKPGASPEQTAAAEALEEAGVTGALERALGELELVRVFPLRVERVHDRWDEEDRRLRAWVPIAEVGRFVRREPLAHLVRALWHRMMAAGVAA